MTTCHALSVSANGYQLAWPPTGPGSGGGLCPVANAV
jgi:hypothetical protein